MILSSPARMPVINRDVPIEEPHAEAWTVVGAQAGPCAGCGNDGWNMDRQEIIDELEKYATELEGILGRFSKTRDGVHIHQDDDGRFKQIIHEVKDIFDDHMQDGDGYAGQLVAFANDSMANWLGSPSYTGVENVKGLVASALLRLKRNPMAARSVALAALASGRKNPEFIERLAERLPTVIRALRIRREHRPTLDVKDEYDLQDLLRSLLAIEFGDIRPEEWTPSYAGASSRMDFLLPEVEAVVETKMARDGLRAGKLGEELIIDIARYEKHAQCRTLYCVVYDPDGRIANPRGVENDLARDGGKMRVRVMIVPR
jgi:hypothetical protein